MKNQAAPLKADKYPHSIEAEQALLGAMMVNADVIPSLSGFLKKEHFFEDLHGDIYETLLKLDELGDPQNTSRTGVVAVKPYFADDPRINDIGGIRYLLTLCDAVVSVRTAPDCARMVRDAWARREAAFAAEELRDAMLAAPEPGKANDLGERVADLEDRLASLRNQTSEKPLITPLVTGMRQALEAMVERRNNPDKLPGIPAGADKINRNTGGFMPGDLVIVGGRPGMGKSAFALHMAASIAGAGYGVLFASLEMPGAQLGQRLMSMIARQKGVSVPFGSIGNGRLTEQQAQAAVEGAQGLADLPIDILEPHVRSLPQILSAIRQRLRYKNKPPLAAVFVDHIGLINVPGKKSGYESITEITKQLKAIAMEAGITVVALSQLNRQVETREDKRPTLSDLRESGSIEQDADAVVFCYRPHYYLTKQEPPSDVEKRADFEADLRRAEHQFDAIFAKLRNGETGTATLHCEIGHNYFSDEKPLPVSNGSAVKELDFGQE